MRKVTLGETWYLPVRFVWVGGKGGELSERERECLSSGLKKKKKKEQSRASERASDAQQQLQSPS